MNWKKLGIVLIILTIVMTVLFIVFASKYSKCKKGDVPATEPYRRRRRY